MQKKYPIGIFDSGIGGLIVAKEIQRQMPNESLIYFGDTKNMPYGEKSKNFIIKNSLKILSFLYKRKCKALVIACNSVTSNAIDVILKTFNNKILVFNVIDPVAKNKILYKSKKVLILATPATVSSNFYLKQIKKYHNHIKIIQVSIPFLSTLIEKGKNINIIMNWLKMYINFRSYDTIILACTHYLFIKNFMEKFYKKRIINVPYLVVQEIKNTLQDKKLFAETNNLSKKIFYKSGNKNDIFFIKKVKLLFKKKCFQIEI